MSEKLPIQEQLYIGKIAASTISSPYSYLLSLFSHLLLILSHDFAILINWKGPLVLSLKENC